MIAALDEAGCLVLENAIEPCALTTIKSELAPWFDDARFGQGPFFGRGTKRFSGVFAKAPTTAALALHEDILSAVETVLLGPDQAHADCIQLSQTQAIEIEPGEPAQLLHRDDSVFPMAKHFELIVNVMWTLDRFTADNGATRLAPGSHRWERLLNEQYQDEIIAAEAPPGSAIIWLGSLIHGGGQNRTTLSRRGLVMSYSLGWLAPAEKLLLSIPSEVARALPERLQRLIGYQLHRPNLGWVEGCDPFHWLHGEIGVLASAQDNLTPVQSELLSAYLAAAGR
ncbi:MAG: phytanoyl-CoA dioxygenase family protein [Pseudomonadota bacterium]